MRWIKVAAVVVGALIAFVVLESVWHLLVTAAVIAGIVLAIGAVVALAVKARRQYRLAQERRARIKAQRRAERERRQLGAEPVAATPVRTPRQEAAVPRHDVNVEDELARLKREMGAG
jgi:hypothetical protein